MFEYLVKELVTIMKNIRTNHKLYKTLKIPEDPL